MPMIQCIDSRLKLHQRKHQVRMLGYSHMTSGDLGKSPNTFMGCKFRKNSCPKCKGEHGLNTC